MGQREAFNRVRHPEEPKEEAPPSDSVVLGSWMDESTYAAELKKLEERGLRKNERDPRDAAFLKRMFPNLE